MLIRSARQTFGRGWNQHTGAGVVDGTAATALARAYDVSPPPARGRRPAPRRVDVAVRLGRANDRSERGREVAGHLRYGRAGLARRRPDLQRARQSGDRPLNRVVRLKGSEANVLVASACDANGNCGLKRLGRFRRY